MFAPKLLLSYLQHVGVLAAALLWTVVAFAQDDQQQYGYFVKGDSICFEFTRSQYDHMIQKGNDKQFLISDLSIYDVTLVINFQRDQPASFPMQAIDSNTYRIAFPLDTLSKPDWTFRFYINGYYIAEPPVHAINRIPSDVDQGYYFITLLRHNLFRKQNPKSIITDENAQQWLDKHGTKVDSEAGMKIIQEILQSGKALGIGRPTQDSMKTFPLRLAMAQWLVNKMDYHLLSFQIDPTTSRQLEQYTEEDTTYLDNHTLEIINIIKWSDLKKRKLLNYKPLYMGYQKKDIESSLEILETYAPVADTLLHQEILQLVHEVNSLLMLQEEWGVYYYDSPSYQKYLSRLWNSVSDKLKASERYEYEPYKPLKPALAEVKKYLKHLNNLKGYYKGVDKQLAKYFYWIDKPKLDVRFVVWDDNHEVSHSQPGTIGKYLSKQYEEAYISVGVGSYRTSTTSTSKNPDTTISMETPFIQNFQGKSSGQQAFVIDLRKEKLTPEEQLWLEEKIYAPDEHKRHAGKLTEEFDLLILVKEED